MKILSARITDMPKCFTDPLPEVYATFEDGEERRLFDYFPDEIEFTPADFVGLTEAESTRLKFDRDVKWLRN